MSSRTRSTIAVVGVATGGLLAPGVAPVQGATVPDLSAVPAASAVPARAPEAARATPVLVAVRAAHHPGLDRVVLQFRGGLPGHRVGYVSRLLQDASGRPVRIAGRAVLRVRLSPAQAHDGSGTTAPDRVAYDLPNVTTLVRAGDFEGVTTYGVGLARRTPVRVSTLRAPDRLVLDIGTAFPTRRVGVGFVDSNAVSSGTGPDVALRARSVRTDQPVVGALDRLFAGVTPREHAAGLRLVRSGATGARVLGVVGGVARVQLTGGCDSGGSTVTVAQEITRTLRPFGAVRWVKVYDPQGRTERPAGASDSIPTCLEP